MKQKLRVERMTNLPTASALRASFESYFPGGVALELRIVTIAPLTSRKASKLNSQLSTLN